MKYEPKSTLNSDGKEFKVQELSLFLQNKLSSFKIPKKIFIEKELPKTELGKVERNKLIKKYSATNL